MTDWIRYLKERANSKLWGFVALDYYKQQKASNPGENPSRFIDRILSELGPDAADPIFFHDALLGVCVALLGADFSDTMQKSIWFLRNWRGSITQDQMEAVLSQYGAYRQRQTFVERLNSSGIQVGSVPVAVEGGKLEMPIADTRNNGLLQEAPMQQQKLSMIRVFVSYSHQDRQYLQENSLLGYLKGLESEGFEFWSDQRIITSDIWDQEIKNHIEATDIALVLVSQAFLNSRYCQDVEITKFLEARKKKGLRVFPVILSPCDWKSHKWLSSTQFQPTDDRTVERDFTPKGKRKELFLKILQDLRTIAERIRQSRSAGRPI